MHMHIDNLECTYTVDTEYHIDVSAVRTAELSRLSKGDERTLIGQNDGGNPVTGVTFLFDPKHAHLLRLNRWQPRARDQRKEGHN